MTRLAVSRPLRPAALLMAAVAMAAAPTGPALAFDAAPVAPSAILGNRMVPLQVDGRVEALGPGGFVHEWPGVYADGRFAGDRLVLLFDDAGTWRIRIDGGAPRTIDGAGAARAVAFWGLGPGPHAMRMEKTSESVGAVVGAFVPATGDPLPPPAPNRRQIEFIGDSDLVGYGVHAPGRSCTPGEVRRNTDTQAAYGALTGQALGADYQILAVSGIGLTRNYGGARPGEEMPAIYRSGPPAPAEWHPQIIVLDVGSNDFSPPSPDESLDDLQVFAAYERGLAAFAADLLARHPDAFLVVGSSGEEYAWTEATRAAIAQLGPGIAHRVGLVTFPARALTGCHHHPSEADQALMARFLTDWIAARPELWR